MRMSTLVIAGASGDGEIISLLIDGGWDVVALAPEGTSSAHRFVTASDMGGPAGLAGFLTTRGIDVVLDAAAPFAVDVHTDVAEATRAARLPLVAYDPPAWPFPPKLQVSQQAGAQQAAEMVRTRFHHILVDCGRGAIDPGAFSCDSDNLYVLREPASRRHLPARHRVIDPAGGQRDVEKQVLKDNQIDAVVLPDTGEALQLGVIEAAAELAIPVVVVSRPRPFGSRAQVVNSVQDAVRAL